MTQNLDFDLPTDGSSLVPATSDVKNPTPITATKFTNETTVSEWTNDDTIIQFYDPGMYVYTTPTTANRCTSITSLSSCTDRGWQYVGSGYNPSDKLMSSVINGNTYDAHYLAGNYYSWLAVVAGTGSGLATDGAVAGGSICPYGWKLPLSGNSNGSNNTKAGSFYNLLKSYGFSFDDSGTSNSVISGTGYNATAAPLYFMRSGHINTKGGLGHVGYQINLRSSVANSGNSAWYLVGSDEGIYPSSANRWIYGFPARCVATSS